MKIEISQKEERIELHKETAQDSQAENNIENENRHLKKGLHDIHIMLETQMNNYASPENADDRLFQLQQLPFYSLKERSFEMFEFGSFFSNMRYMHTRLGSPQISLISYY